jgi:TRAP-type mannitol/chloroaromatic compound transport system substrate-binding protein
MTFKMLTCAVVLFAATTAAAAAQSRNCAEHATVVDRLASGYGETRQSIGIGADNTVVEVFASLATGTWTITITQAGGPTCLVASGAAFQVLAEALPNTDSGA